jgi:putative phosphoesterase
VKIALVADVHGNLPAFETVLDEVAREAPEEVYLLGDLLGTLGFPEECAALARSRKLIGVIGNIDIDVLRAPHEAAKRSDRRVFERLSAASVRWVGTLPWTRRVERGGRQILFAHGTPRNPSEPLRANLDRDEVRALLGNGRTDVVASGHTHMPAVADLGDLLLVNPGSVGRPIDGDPRASYAVIEVRERPRAFLRRAVYDVERAARAMAEQGAPAAAVEALRRGQRA